MKLNQHFKQFHRNIKLNKSRLNRISSALSNLQDVVNNDDQISEISVDLFQQGSVAINTSVIPIKENEEFDADAVIALNIVKKPQDQQDPQNIIDWFADRLRKNKKIKPKVFRKTRCVRINYEGDFHLDVVPAWGDTKGIVLVPIKEDGEWIWKPSDPRGYIGWANNIDLLYNRKFNRIIKMLKHWRNFKIGKETSPKSILLTALVGYRIDYGDATRCSSDAEALVEVMETLNAHLKKYMNKPQVFNPTLQSEDLAEHWNDDHFRIFKNKLEAATLKARQALDETSKDKSIELWQEIFGNKYFPKTLDNSAKIAEAVNSTNNVFVSSTGQISIGKPDNEDGVMVQNHRSFGQ